MTNNPNTVLNIIAVAKQSSDGAKIAACEAQGIETMQATDFVVARNDLQQSKVIETQLPDAAALPDDALLVKVTASPSPPTTSPTPCSAIS